MVHLKKWWGILAILVCVFVFSGNTASAQILQPPSIFNTRTCSDIAMEIAMSTAEIGMLNAQKVMAQTNHDIAMSNMATAAANAANNPLWASYYNMQAAMYSSQAFWYLCQVEDIQWWIDKENAKLQALNAEYTAKGC